MRGERNEDNETLVIDMDDYHIRMYGSYYCEYMDRTNDDDTRTSNE